VFSPILIPSLFRIQISWWNWAMSRLRLLRGNPRASQRFSRRELLAGLPAGAWGWPLARAAMPTVPRARLPMPTLASVQVTLGLGAALGWLGWGGGLDPHSWLSMCSAKRCSAQVWVGILILAAVLAPLSSAPGPCGTPWVPGRGCCRLPFLPFREGSGDVVAERGGSLSKNPWPKLTKLGAVSLGFPRSQCGRGLSAFQAGSSCSIGAPLPPRRGAAEQPQGHGGAWCPPTLAPSLTISSHLKIKGANITARLESVTATKLN